MSIKIVIKVYLKMILENIDNLDLYPYYTYIDFLEDAFVNFKVVRNYDNRRNVA